VSENSVSLRLSTGPLVAPVLCRVVSMVLARADCPMDRLDDALIACDALSAHAPAYAMNGHLDFTVTTDDSGFKLRLGALAEHGALQLVQDAQMPGVGNVLERVTDELRLVPARDGKGEELVLEISF
jgi:serine/threonine-protein kinase RsbW